MCGGLDGGQEDEGSSRPCPASCPTFSPFCPCCACKDLAGNMHAAFLLTAAEHVVHSAPCVEVSMRHHNECCLASSVAYICLRLMCSLPHQHLCSYKWAEVLSADAFGAFEDAGLDDEKAVQASVTLVLWHNAGMRS